MPCCFPFAPRRWCLRASASQEQRKPIRPSSKPTPYLSFADSPFNGASFSFFYNETFEDHLLNTPGLSANAGGVTSVVFGPSIHDSVDADDGAINGSGLNGDDYFTGAGSAGVTFAFNAAALGGLPTIRASSGRCRFRHSGHVLGIRSGGRAALHGDPQRLC